MPLTVTPLLERTPYAVAANVVMAGPTTGSAALPTFRALVAADFSGAVQPLDATLTALAGVTVAADKIIYATGADAFATTDFTSVARTFVNQTTQDLLRTTGLGMSANASSLVTAADYAAMRTLLGLDTDDAVTFGDLTVSNLIVNGTTTTVNSTTLAVDDPLIAVGDGNAADSVDLGLYATYTSSGAKYAGVFRDATDGKWKLFTALEELPTTTVNTAGTGYSVGTLVANLEATTATVGGSNVVTEGGTQTLTNKTLTTPTIGDFTNATHTHQSAATGGVLDTFPEDINLTGDISPTELSADQNDYSPTGLSTASTLRLSSDASRTLTGLAGGSDGRILLLHNVGSNPIVLSDSNVLSSAANRFALNADITVGVDQAVLLQYDSTSSRWRAVSSPISGGVPLTDGDKGDIAVTGSGASWTIDGNTVTFSKLQQIATDTLIGRSTAGTGNAESITCTAAARSILDDTTVGAILDTLGAATHTGTGGVVCANTPTLVTPVLGVATATTINKVAFTAPATGSTLTIADGATLTVSASATISSGTHSGTNTGDQTRASLGIDTTDAVTFGDLTVSNLTVNGTTTTVNSTTVAVDDPLFAVGDGNAADSVDLGIYGTYTSTGAKYTGFFRDASDGKYKAFTALEEAPTSTVNIAGTGYSVATIVANIEGNVTGNLTGNASGSSGSCTGNAATATILATTRAIYGNDFDGSAALTQIIASTYGGTGNGFTKFTGATTAEKTYTLPDASCTILTSNDAVTVAQGGTGLTALGTGLQVLRTNAGATAMEWATAAGGGDVSDGGTLTTGLTFPNTGLHILDTDASHDLIIAPGSNITADRTLTITTGDANRTLTLTGNLTMSGAFNLTVTTTGTTTVTLPTTGTLATLAGTETLSGKTLTTPKIGNFGYIADANGNESVVFQTVASAVTYIQISNGATGNSPKIQAKGETNTGLLLSGNGTGKLQIGDGADTTKLLTIELVGATTAKTLTLVSSHTDDRSITFPNATDTLVGKATTDTLTNKRITPRIGTEASSATSTPTADSVDQWNVTALAVSDAFAAPTGTPTDGQVLVIRIKDNGTARALTWNAIYRAGTDVALPSTTVLTKTLYLGFKYNAADSKWDLLAVTNNI